MTLIAVIAFFARLVGSVKGFICQVTVNNGRRVLVISSLILVENKSPKSLQLQILDFISPVIGTVTCGASLLQTDPGKTYGIPSDIIAQTASAMSVRLLEPKSSSSTGWMVLHILNHYLIINLQLVFINLCMLPQTTSTLMLRKDDTVLICHILCCKHTSYATTPPFW